MVVLGVELAGDSMHYIAVQFAEGAVEAIGKNNLKLSETRDRSALSAFQSAVTTTINTYSPGIIGVKLKPETGRLRAGAAALKMEAILLASATCEVDFVSGARVNACNAPDAGLPKYMLPAFKVAIAAYENAKN